MFEKLKKSITNILAPVPDDGGQENAEIKLRIVNDSYLAIDLESLKKSKVVKEQARLASIQTPMTFSKRS